MQSYDHPILMFSFLALMLAEVVLGVWSVVLVCHTVAEVQGFRSAWRGLGNICLAIAVVVLPLLLFIGSLLFLTSRT